MTTNYNKISAETTEQSIVATEEVVATTTPAKNIPTKKTNTAEYASVKVNKGRKLNVRATPDQYGKIIGKLERLEKVTIDPVNTTPTHYKITSASGLSGYVSRSFIQLSRKGVKP